jgi:hypothetical protein
MALDAWHPVADAGIMDNQEIAWPSTLLVCKVGVSSRFFVQRVYDAFSRYSNAWPAGDRRIETELKRSIRQRAGVHQLAACCCPSRSVHMRLTLRACHRFLITLEHQLWILRCWDCAARPTTTSALLRGHCSNHLFCLRQSRQRDQRGSHDEGVHHVGNLYFCRSVHFTIASTLGPFSPCSLHTPHGNCICVRPRQCVLHRLASRSNHNHGMCVRTWCLIPSTKLLVCLFVL